MSNVCRNCHHEGSKEALFCIMCGTELVRGGDPITVEIDFDDGIIGTAYKPSAIPTTTTHLSLVIMETREIIPLVGRDEFILGRKGEDTTTLPDIDLTLGGGLNLGVSRQHASIKVGDSSYSITDIGSTNGTRVNGVKIIPHQDHLLNHGDLISLGRLLFQVLIPEN